MITVSSYFIFVYFVLNLQNVQASDTIVYPGERSKSPQEVNPLNYNRFHYHHHHHHHHQDNLNQRNWTDQIKNDSEIYLNDTNSNEIPVDFVAKLNGHSYTVNDLLLHYVDGYEEDEGNFFENRFGESEERANVQIPKPAQCIPELQTVSLRQSPNPTTMYLPSCTRIERCGGCCNHNKLECQPMEIENVNFQVIKTEFSGGAKLRFVEKIAVTLERHKKCACGCKIKAEHCTLRQEYRENECRCVCRNLDEQKKCAKEYKKLWDSESCECQCRNSTICTTGTTFDDQECKCVLTSSMRRRYVDFPQNNTPTVVPLDTN
ncbi:uncharacterized protein [Onthophagus taurus]|uniref:uncharacterized protein n=1 Tax=Onthophagus taurus TaxID=166361 RepID=UPI0039BE116D